MIFRSLLAAIVVGLLTVPAIAADRISIDARDTDLVDVLRLIATQSGRNIVTDASVKSARITFRLRDVTSDTALTTLTQAYNLQTHRAGNVTIVGDAATMNRRYPGDAGESSPHTEVFTLARAKPDEVAKALGDALPAGTVAVPDKRTSSVIVTGSATTLERVRLLLAALDAPAAGAGAHTATIRLRNARPSDAVKILKGSLPENSVVADDRDNTVIVTGTSDALDTATALLAGIDKPGKQVMFEVRVTDVRPIDDSSNVGVEFGGAGFGAGAQGQFPYALTKSSVTVNAQVNALVQRGRAQILATPRIATVNNREASMLIGEQYPVVTVNQQTGYPSVQTIDVGVRLRVTPTIGDDGTITAELHPEYSQIIGFNQSFPIIANRKVDSTLRVHDGETIVLGGLFQDVTSETVTKFPFLGDIPVLGTFFRNRATSAQRNEVIFFITPHIL